MKKILSLDIGTTTGWALRDRYGVVSGSQSFKPSRFEGAGMRFVKFRQWLSENFKDLDLVTFEEVRRHLGVDAAHAYGGFMAHLTAFCETNKIPYQGVPVGTIKSFATSKGNANKEKMIEACKIRGFNPQDDNEADAIALVHYSLYEYDCDVKKPLGWPLKNPKGE